MGHRMKLKCRIEEIRREKRLTQSALSELSGVAINLISAYENEIRYPNAHTLWKLSAALECSVDDLYEVIEK